MTIDWFTFAAQIINFLILVILLRRFLYGPIVRAMERREEQIAERLHQAEQKLQEGEEQARQYQLRTQEFDEQRETLLKNARHEADEQRRRLTLEVREDVQRKRLDWLHAFDREREDLLTELQRLAGQMSAKAARRALAQLADESLEERMFAEFDSRLRTLDDKRRQQIKAFMGNGNGIFVRSAFKVSPEWRGRLKGTVRDQFGYDGNIDFQESPDLICGIELEAGGYGFGWNLNEFLRSLEVEFDTRLKRQAGIARK